MLLSAVASCFTTTFQALRVTANLNSSTLKFRWKEPWRKRVADIASPELLTRPKLSVPNESSQERGLGLLKKVKSLCLVTRALAIPQEFEVQVEVRNTVPVD